MTEVLRPLSAAAHWRKQDTPPKGCPIHDSTYEPTTHRPELHGRLAREIEPVVNLAMSTYYEMGTISGVNPEAIDLSAGKNIDEMDTIVTSTIAEAWRNALEDATLITFLSLQHPTILQNRERLETIFEDRAAALAHLNVSHSSTPGRIIDGSETAASQTTALASAMNSFLRKSGVNTEREAIITRSTGPIRRLTGTDIITVGHTDIELVKDIELFAFGRNGWLAFTEDFEVLLSEAEQQAKKQLPELTTPELGCPILLNPRQLQEVWFWGVDMMGKTGMFNDYGSNT